MSTDTSTKTQDSTRTRTAGERVARWRRAQVERTPDLMRSVVTQTGLVPWVVAAVLVVWLVQDLPPAVESVLRAWPQLSVRGEAVAISVGIGFLLAMVMLSRLFSVMRQMGALQASNETIFRAPAAERSTHEMAVALGVPNCFPGSALMARPLVYRADRQAARVVVARAAGGRVTQCRVVVNEADSPFDGLCTVVFADADRLLGQLLVSVAGSCTPQPTPPGLWVARDMEAARAAARQLVFVDERPSWFPAAEQLSVDTLVQAARAHVRALLVERAALHADASVALRIGAKKRTPAHAMADRLARWDIPTDPASVPARPVAAALTADASQGPGVQA